MKYRCNIHHHESEAERCPKCHADRERLTSSPCYPVEGPKEKELDWERIEAEICYTVVPILIAVFFGVVPLLIWLFMG